MGDSTIRSRGTFTIEPGAEIVVEEGTLTLDAEDAFEITGADLRAAPHTHLSIIARTTLTIRDSVIAPTGVDPNPLGLTPPEAQRATLIIRDAGDGAPSIVLTGTSRVMATVLAPNANVQIGGHTVLYGRVFASRIHAFDDAAIFALPDDGSSIGLSSAYGPHRDEDGHLRDEVTVANRTAPAAMDAIVAALDVPVASAGITIEPNWNETTASSRVVRRAARRAQREAQRHGRRDHRRRWTRRHWSGA
jgi:hypothetical protein